MDEKRKQHSEIDQSEVVAEIYRALREIRFGSIELIIHDARVVQIEKKEKVRFQKQGDTEARKI
jgi:hypothetical protein